MLTQKETWAQDASFYHIYPLGLLGAPLQNDFLSEPINRIERLADWIPHSIAMGCNAWYLGPVFQSSTHGYDTADYFQVDSRLGTNQHLKDLSKQLHQSGTKLVLDAVFNHVGRDFWAFRDVKVHREHSKYKDWFSGLDFNGNNTYDDGFAYEGWNNFYNLVRLNLKNEAVKEYLFLAVGQWIDEYAIDGLRLDVAEIMDKQFLSELAAFCRHRQPDFWLMGEMIHGDYNQLANPQLLDATTNYEIYKGLYSSHNDKNYFEIAYSLNRQFGESGIYKGLLLYNFADNHDTTRVASILKNIQHLFPLYTLLYMIPGIPSLYYGSEWAITGFKKDGDDAPLRPQVKDIPEITDSALSLYIQNLSRIRQQHPALRSGNYRQLYIAPQQFVFERSTGNEIILIAVNAAEIPADIMVNFPLHEQLDFEDALDSGYRVKIVNQELWISSIPASGARILITQLSPC